MSLWLKEIIGLSIDPFTSVVDSSFSSLESTRRMTRDRLNIKGGARLLIEREVVVPFGKDNYLVIKAKPVDIRNIYFTQLERNRGNDQVAFM